MLDAPPVFLLVQVFTKRRRKFTHSINNSIVGTRLGLECFITDIFGYCSGSYTLFQFFETETKVENREQ